MSFDRQTADFVGWGRGATVRGRGLSAGFRRGRGTSNSQPHSSPQPSLKPLGPIIDSIKTNTLLIEEEAPTIADVRYVSSYNWLEGKSPIILVPGSPPAWTPLSTDFRLKGDSGDVFRDINSARYSTFPMEPAVRAILALQPQFDLGSVDVMGCGSTLGNLLRFAGSEPKPFRCDVDVIGDTVFFIRKEDTPTELIRDIKGYGHTFPEAYTTWDSAVRNSCSHQRIIEYDFGGLRFLIRSETDGYIRESTMLKVKDDKTSVEDALGKMAVTNTGSSSDEILVVKLQGMKVPQERIFDIKTRSSYNIFNMDQILPRLWLNQTSKFLLAYHQKGLFDNPQVANIQQKVLEWQEKNAATLGRFHALVKRIVDLVRDSSAQQLEVSWDGVGPLLITKQIGDERRFLPSKLLYNLTNA